MDHHAGEKVLVLRICGDKLTVIQTNEYVAYQLLTKYASDATIKSYVDKYDFYVFPVVNPDGTCETFELVEDVTYDSAGFVYTQTNTRLWRKNRQSVSSSTCIGTDINRNWAVGWNVAGGSSTDPCDETYRGKQNASHFLSEADNLGR